MIITLITKEQYNILVNIQKEYPVLTFQNEGYEYIKKEFNENEKKAYKKVTDILKEYITGFTEFNNFQISNKTKEVKIRFQYDWTADDEENNRSFIGVGYLFLNELLNGFRRTKK